MQDVVDSFTRSAHRCRVAQVSLAEVDLLKNPVKIRGLAGEKVIDPANLFSAIHQGSCQRRSDKARDSRDQIFRHAFCRLDPGETDSRRLTLKIVYRRHYSRAQKAACVKSSDIRCMYFLELNFFPVEAPDM